MPNDHLANPSASIRDRSRQHSRRRAQDLVARMSLDEKVALTVGDGMFTLGAVERLGIPPWPVTDGPNGARGSSQLGTGPAVALCIPSGTALGATWDEALVEQLGTILGEETITKQSKFLLAPTVNLHRSPLAGRNFECFSEDPLLSGKMAAAYIRGVQSHPVGVTVKHLVGNEAETERYTTDSVIDHRTLRELYLLPFELAVTEGGALGIMTSYNRVNGRYVPEDRSLLTDIVRREWGFEGLVMTDWFAAFDTVRAAEAGLDIEMPVGSRGYGALLAEAVTSGRLAEEVVDQMATRIVTVLDHLDAIDSTPGPEQNVVSAAQQTAAGDAAVAATVLLKNDGGLLPLNDPTVVAPEVDTDGLQNGAAAGQMPGGAASGTPSGAVDPAAGTPVQSLAVIGPNALRTQIMGGGSAALRPHRREAMIDVIRQSVGHHIDVSYHPGVSIEKSPPPLSGSLIGVGDSRSPEYRPVVVDYFAGDSLDGQPAGSTTVDQTKLIFGDPPVATAATFSTRMTVDFTPPRSGVHTFELTTVVHTQARVLVDGDLLVDGFGPQRPRSAAFFGSGTEPVEATVSLEAGRSYRLTVETTSPTRPFSGYQLGVGLPMAATAFDDAVTAAAQADAAIVVVGTNDDWETEGEDRTTLDLPGNQDALVSAVAAANPNTVVVLNTGSVVHVPWRNEVPAILQTWFGGQEMSKALVDVIFGRRDPGGRLPTTFPVRVEHNPSHGNFPVENGVVRYGEGVFVGYRWYEHRHLDVAFPFGHGLSYTTFQLGQPTASHHHYTAEMAAADVPVTVTVPITNTGERPGTQVVQVYVGPDEPVVPRPVKELKGFAKVSLDPGQTREVTVALGARSFAHWHQPDPGWGELLSSYRDKLKQFRFPRIDQEPGWVVAPGTFQVLVGTSSAQIDAAIAIQCDGFRLPLPDGHPTG